MLLKKLERDKPSSLFYRSVTDKGETRLMALKPVGGYKSFFFITDTVDK
jgi:hypothetical protein